MNEIIENAFRNFVVPVSFLYDQGHSEAYVTYQQTGIDETLHGDNEVAEYKEYYDFDVYCKGNQRVNYFPIIAQIKQIMSGLGFIWEPTRDSGDLYEPDTGYFHKTICFSIERSYLNG